jgi:hypothetical protein
MIPISAEPAGVLRTNPPGVHRTCHLTVACSPRKRSKRKTRGLAYLLAVCPLAAPTPTLCEAGSWRSKEGTWRPVTDGCVRSGMYA